MGILIIGLILCLSLGVYAMDFNDLPKSLYESTQWAVSED